VKSRAQHKLERQQAEALVEQLTGPVMEALSPLAPEVGENAVGRAKEALRRLIHEGISAQAVDEITVPAAAAAKELEVARAMARGEGNR
jgi:hypothetical protein